MNKKINILKTLLILLIILLNIKVLFIYKLFSFEYLLFLTLMLLFIIGFIKDLKRKRIINSTYDKLFILVFIIISLIFIRTLYDPNFIYNSKYYMELISDKITYNNDLSLSDVAYINMLYLNQNIWYLLLMVSLLFSYKFLNMKKENNKYHPVSVICLILSILSIILSIECLEGTIGSLLFFLIFNIILVITEIYRLIKDNKIKKEWIIYLSFIFNLFAFISIFINIII